MNQLALVNASVKAEQLPKDCDKLVHINNQTTCIIFKLVKINQSLVINSVFLQFHQL